MMLIRTGILHNPVMDTLAGEAVRACLVDAQTRASRFVVLHESAVGDSRNWIEDVLCRWCDEEELDLVLTIGGTMPAPGPSNRQLLPLCTANVVERHLPGLAEAMRAHAGEFTELALLDGSLAGIRGRTLVLNLPEGAGPAVCFLQAVAHVLGPVLSHLQEGQPPVRLVDALDVEWPGRAAEADERADAGSGVEQGEAGGQESKMAAGETRGSSADSVVPDTVASEEPGQPYSDKSSETTATPRSRLSADEFAEFLQRRGRARS